MTCSLDVSDLLVWIGFFTLLYINLAFTATSLDFVLELSTFFFSLPGFVFFSGLFLVPGLQKKGLAVELKKPWFLIIFNGLLMAGLEDWLPWHFLRYVCFFLCMLFLGFNVFSLYTSRFLLLGPICAVLLDSSSILLWFFRGLSFDCLPGALQEKKGYEGMGVLLNTASIYIF